MAEPVAIIISLVIGTTVGLGYFAGMWITAQTLPNAKRPRLLWALSAILRVLLRWGTTYAIAGVAGFVIGRFGAMAIWGVTREPKLPPAPPRT